MTAPISDHDRELLSRLLDGQLSEGERTNLQSRLVESPQLAGEWLELQRVRAALRALPRHKVRRSFILKTGSVPSKRTSPFLMPLRLASGLASAALVVLLALDALPLLGGMAARSAAPMAPAAASEAEMMGKASGETAADNIITWSTPTIEAYGKGGGPSENAADPGAMAPLAQAVPPPAQPSGIIPTEISEIPSVPDEALREGPILGIPPAEDQGQVIVSETRAPNPESPAPFPILPAVEVALLLLAAGCAVAAVLLGRRK